jgi:hypothetical protein
MARPLLAQELFGFQIVAKLAAVESREQPASRVSTRCASGACFGRCAACSQLGLFTTRRRLNGRSVVRWPAPTTLPVAAISAEKPVPREITTMPPAHPRWLALRVAPNGEAPWCAPAPAQETIEFPC